MVGPVPGSIWGKVAMAISPVCTHPVVELKEDVKVSMCKDCMCWFGTI